MTEMVDSPTREKKGGETSGLLFYCLSR